MRLKLKTGLILPLCALVAYLLFNLHDRSLAAEEAVHLVNRLSFGAAPQQIQQVRSQGIEQYIQTQLHPETIPESRQFEQQLQQWQTLQLNNAELIRQYRPTTGKQREQLTEEQIEQEQQKIRNLVQESVESHLYRAIASQRQLQEVMVDFWFNHFNVYLAKGPSTRIWTGNYLETAIRPHVFGKFRDLLGATAHHPAMLDYLDNWLNSNPDSAKKGPFKGLNENYARELMELHTLGVNGGYTQADVKALARILTGWGIDRNTKGETAFRFYPARHDFSNKVLLGVEIAGSGEAEVEQALDILAAHPSTARHVALKLAQYFVVDQPPPSLVERLSQKFTQTDGDIRAVLETLFTSPEFDDPQYRGNKFKTPYQYIISAVRATGAQNIKLQRVRGMLNQLNMPPLACPTPDGYAQIQSAWLNPDAMLLRLNMATAIANGATDQNGQKVAPSSLMDTLGNNLPPQTKQVVTSSPPRFQSGLILGSPQMMYR